MFVNSFQAAGAETANLDVTTLIENAIPSFVKVVSFLPESGANIYITVIFHLSLFSCFNC